MVFKEKKIPEQHKSSESEMLRRFKQNPFIFIGTFVVLVIVIIAFVLVPAIVPEFGGANIDLTFGYYDKVPINYVPGNFFSQYYNMVAHYRQNTEGGNTSYANYETWRQSFEAAAVHTAILHEMKKFGYTAPAKVVDREVARLPQFMDNGRFSTTLYRQMDENARISLWKQVQDDIAKARFRSDVVGLLKPGAEAEFVGKMAAVERSFEMALFPVNNYPEEEYRAFAENNAGLFRSVHLSMITPGSSKREAERVLASVRNGEITFEDAARSYSKDSYVDRGGDMGIRIAHELAFEISDESEREKVITLARGEYSDVIQTPAGWSFFRVEEAVQKADLSDEAVMERVRSYVRNYEQGRMEDWAIGKANDFIALAGELDFNEALLQQGVTSHSFGPVPLNYGNVDILAALPVREVTELSSAVSDENFWKVAFSTPVNTLSQPVVQGANVLVLCPTAETMAEESAIETIASIYNAYWLDYMSEQSLHQYFMSSPKMEDKFLEIYFRYFMD